MEILVATLAAINAERREFLVGTELTSLFPVAVVEMVAVAITALISIPRTAIAIMLVSTGSMVTAFTVVMVKSALNKGQGSNSLDF